MKDHESGAKIRKDESFAKNYLVGKYGATISLKALDILGRTESMGGNTTQQKYNRPKD